MKTIALYSIYLLFFSFTVQAQVLGVNTENPTRSVDVNGKVRITGGNNLVVDLNSPTSNGSNLHLVVADNQGNLDKVSVPAIPTVDPNLEVFSRVIILGGTNTPSSTQIPDLVVGGFVFGVPNGVPSFRKVDGNATTFQYGVKIMDRRHSSTNGTNNYNSLQYGHSAGSGDGRIYFRNYTKSVGSTNMVSISDNITTGTFNSFEITNSTTGQSTPKSIPKNRTNTLARRDYYRVHLVHPDENPSLDDGHNYFYKVTYVRLQNSGIPLSVPVPDTSWNVIGSTTQADIWVITVERYNNK